MIPRRARAVVAGVLACAAVLCPAAGGAAVSTISYLSGGSAYVDAGRLDGVLQGDTLAVVARDSIVAKLLVTFVSSRRSACDTLWTLRALALGDSVRFAAHGIAPDDSVSVALGSGVRPSQPAHPARLHGRVGARWLSVDGANSSFRQPALDLRVDGGGGGSGHMDLAVDMRSRRTSRDFGGVRTNEQLARFYRASLTLHSLDAHRRLTVGRQSSPTLASINLFDGALFELATDRHSVGLFSGTQPEPIGLGLSGDILQSGAYAEWHQAPLAERRWSVATGGVTSQQSGQSNRDFLFAQSGWYTKGLNVSFAQEVDVNSGWRRSRGEAVLSPTSTFATAYVPLTGGLGLNAGYDNRHNVRLYRDRLTPETQFDDQYREGAWVGGQWAGLGGLRLGGETRGSFGVDHAHSWTVNGEIGRLSRLNGVLRFRASQFYNGNVDSRLASAGLGFDPLRLSHVEVTAGSRHSSGAFTAGDDTEQWESVDVDCSLARTWYLNGGWERDHGGSAGDTRQLQAGLSRRF